MECTLACVMLCVLRCFVDVCISVDIYDIGGSERADVFEGSTFLGVLHYVQGHVG